MRWYAIRRDDGKYYSDQKDMVTIVGPQWVSTASSASLYWGHRGELTVKNLRGAGCFCELLAVEVSVRKGTQPSSPAKPTRGHKWACAACKGINLTLDTYGNPSRCRDCGADTIVPA